MKLETEHLVITKFDLSMAEAVHKNSLDEDNRRFVPDEVFETVEDAKETIEFLMSCYESGEGPLVYPRHPRRYWKSADLKRNTREPENIREILRILPDMY